MSDTTKSTALPSVRRVITGHTPEGKAIVIHDEPAPRKELGKNVFNNICRTETVPASIDSELTTGAFVDEISLSKEIFSATGSVFRTVDYAPGTVVPFHRTVTLDYVVVTQGSIVLELEDGKKVTLNESDTLCQRGTMHSWRNETSEWARLYVVSLGAKPIVITRELKEEFRRPSAS